MTGSSTAVAQVRRREEESLIEKGVRQHSRLGAYKEPNGNARFIEGEAITFPGRNGGRVRRPCSVHTYIPREYIHYRKPCDPVTVRKPKEAYESNSTVSSGNVGSRFCMGKIA